MNPPDRGGDEKRQPLNLVRGGTVCNPGDKGASILKGSMQPAVCMPTAGPDSRPRYRQAGKGISAKSRHSVQALQHRKGGKPYGQA